MVRVTEHVLVVRVTQIAVNSVLEVPIGEALVDMPLEPRRKIMLPRVPRPVLRRPSASAPS